MLQSLKQSSVFQKNGSKRNLIEISSLNYGKVIFTLQDKIVIVSIGFIPIYIRYFELEKSFSKLVKSFWYRSLEHQDRVGYPLKIVFKVL